MAEKEYIERVAALEIIKRTSGDYAAAFSDIRQLPAADVVEVVRCKDCKHFHAVETGMFCDKYVSIHDASRNPQDFCSFAARKEPAHV